MGSYLYLWCFGAFQSVIRTIWTWCTQTLFLTPQQYRCIYTSIYVNIYIYLNIYTYCTSIYIGYCIFLATKMWCGNIGENPQVNLSQVGPPPPYDGPGPAVVEAEVIFSPDKRGGKLRGPKQPFFWGYFLMFKELTLVPLVIMIGWDLWRFMEICWDLFTIAYVLVGTLLYGLNYVCMAECITKLNPIKTGMYPESLVNWSRKPVSVVK